MRHGRPDVLSPPSLTPVDRPTRFTKFTIPFPRRQVEYTQVLPTGPSSLLLMLFISPFERDIAVRVPSS